jgi:hypothetical protein
MMRIFGGPETIQSRNRWRSGHRVYGRSCLCRERVQPSRRRTPNAGGRQKIATRIFLQRSKRLQGPGRWQTSGWELLQRKRRLRNRWKQAKVVMKFLPSKLTGASGKGRLRYFSDSLVLVRPVNNGLTDASLCT